MSELQEWLESNRDRLHQAGFTLETFGDGKVLTVLGENPVLGFSLTEWLGLGLEFNAMSYLEEIVIPVAEADRNLSVKDKCDYYFRQIEVYISGLS